MVTPVRITARLVSRTSATAAKADGICLDGAVVKLATDWRPRFAQLEFDHTPGAAKNKDVDRQADKATAATDTNSICALRNASSSAR